jgi:hypothetical protein
VRFELAEFVGGIRRKRIHRVVVGGCRQARSLLNIERCIAPTVLAVQAAAATSSVLGMGHPAVRAMLTDDQAPTCSLAEFLDAWNEDANLVWRVRTGHLIHLLAAAVARIEALEMLLSELEPSGLDPKLANRLGTALDRANGPAAEPEGFHRREEHPPRLGWLPHRRKAPT